MNEQASGSEDGRRELPPGRYILSGLPPGGNDGTGRFFAALLPYAEQYGYGVLCPQPGTELGPAEWEQLRQIRDSRLILLHPQTLGPSLVLDLCKNNNDIHYYVLDNSFFCMRSYNHRGDHRTPCLDCLGDVDNCHSSCAPFPVDRSREEYQAFLKGLQQHAEQITFYCQIPSQELLVRQHFGAEVTTRVIGMKTDEYSTDPESVPAPPQTFDIVFHANALMAKGVDYALKLACFLPEYSFLFPFHVDMLSRLEVRPSVPTNATFHDCRWTDGLASFVTHAELVLCPSVWSAPVEGAVMKSLYYNGSVAVVDGEYSFGHELPEDLVLKMSTDIVATSKQVRAYLSEHRDRRTVRKRSQDWVMAYNRNVDYAMLFVDQPAECCTANKENRA